VTHIKGWRVTTAWSTRKISVKRLLSLPELSIDQSG